MKTFTQAKRSVIHGRTPDSPEFWYRVVYIVTF